jgi:hypothetical protein
MTVDEILHEAQALPLNELQRLLVRVNTMYNRRTQEARRKRLSSQGPPCRHEHMELKHKGNQGADYWCSDCHSMVWVDSSD